VEILVSILDGHGYFFNDNRASGGKLVEDDLLGCGHCPKPLKKREWRMQGGMCFVCNKPLCLQCYERARTIGCEGPDVDRLMRAVNEQYRRAQNAKVLGI
jgi:hypothetical protein